MLYFWYPVNSCFKGYFIYYTTITKENSKNKIALLHNLLKRKENVVLHINLSTQKTEEAKFTIPKIKED